MANYVGSYNNKGAKKGEWNYFYENGKPRETSNYVNGIKHGKHIQWFEKGVYVDTKGKNRRGHQTGKWSYNFETGGLSRIQNFKNGKLCGKSIIYYPNSTIQAISNYSIINDSRKGKLQSVPDGEWIFYDKTGKEINRMRYSRGIKQ